MATWSDLDELESDSKVVNDDEEEANLCLMAIAEIHFE